VRGLRGGFELKPVKMWRECM